MKKNWFLQKAEGRSQSHPKGRVLMSTDCMLELQPRFDTFTALDK